MSFEGTFPFGQPSTVRPSRRPAGDARLFVLGVYPSALHIRWRLPEWARARFGMARHTVGALAVDVEPEVFWDGRDQDALVARWKEKVNWVGGDGLGCFGSCSGTGSNGSSGRAVVEGVLEPMGIKVSETWFTDCIRLFFIKSSTGRPQQAQVIHNVYEPIAKELGLEPANLPARPGQDALVKTTVRDEAARLRTEIAESRAGLLVTLGEEPRRVICAIAEEVGGAPSTQLRIGPDYGQRGWLRLGGRTIDWYALAHPGNRSSRWTESRGQWEERMRTGGEE